MNLKDRLSLINSEKENIIQTEETGNFVEFKNETAISEIFYNSDKTVEILSDLFSSDRNIIVASSIDCDKTLILQYIKHCIPQNFSVEVMYNINKDIQFISANKIILPEVSINGFVKTLEYILYGYGNFIFELNIKSYENILETLKTLISIYYPNFTESNINNLLGQSSAAVIYIEKNIDGLFYISNIGEIEYLNNQISLKSLFDSLNQDENNSSEEESNIIILPEENNDEDINAKEINTEEYTEQDDVIETVETNESSEVDTDITENINTDETEEKLLPEKTNKYKLLKEKIRKKKLESSYKII